MNPFNDNMHLHQDYDFVVKAAVKVGATCVAFDDDLDDPVAVHIRHEGSSTDCFQSVPRVGAPRGFPAAQLRALLVDRQAARRLEEGSDYDEDDDEIALFGAAAGVSSHVGPAGGGDWQE